MSKKNGLIIAGIKLIHTLIFIVIVTCVFYILYTAFVGTRSFVLYLCIGIVLLEGVALIIFKGHCPLTNLAQKYGDEDGHVADLFFPDWFLPFFGPIISFLFIAGILLIIFRMLLRM